MFFGYTKVFKLGPNAWKRIQVLSSRASMLWCSGVSYSLVKVKVSDDHFLVSWMTWILKSPWLPDALISFPSVLWCCLVHSDWPEYKEDTDLWPCLFATNMYSALPQTPPPLIYKTFFPFTPTTDNLVISVISESTNYYPAASYSMYSSYCIQPNI